MEQGSGKADHTSQHTQTNSAAQRDRASGKTHDNLEDWWQLQAATCFASEIQRTEGVHL